MGSSAGQRLTPDGDPQAEARVVLAAGADAELAAEANAGAQAPSGLIAMLFIDLEGSTRLAALLGDEWGRVLETYSAIVIGTVRSSNGWLDGVAGDGFFVTFGDVAQAGRAATAIQRAMRAQPWPAVAGELRVRMGLHVGPVERRGQRYVGLEIHRAARVGAAAHGGQLLMTGAAAELLREVVPSQPLGAHRLKDFSAPTALFCAVIDGRGAAAFPPPRTLELRAGSVPAASQRLIGREHDLERLRTAFDQEHERLVTLLGRGGVGKTAVALAAAHELFEDAGGVWWIEGAREREAAELWSLIARVCRIGIEGPAEEAVIADLGSRGPLLLVLDNLEGVADAGSMIDSLLTRLPDVRVLATSQLPLHARHERQLRLGCLQEAEALALLVRTAERLDVQLDDEPAALELVRLLDGLPLAIELAAGRLRMFRAGELVSRLRESTSILQDRTRPERQRSLKAALDWTLDLLDPEARELFTRLGVFAGPVELVDVEAVTGAGLDVISAVDTLLQVALLHRVETGDGVVRIGYPEAIRDQASALLDAADGAAWRRAHADWQRELVWPLRIYEICESRAVERAQSLAAETQAALAWAWEHDRQLAREIALGRYSLASRAGALQEAMTLLDRVLEDPGAEPQVVELAREHSMLRRASSSDASDRAGLLIALLPELSDVYARFLCLTNIVIVLTWQGRNDEALAWNDETLRAARQISPLAEASTLAIRADTLLEAGREAEAEAAIRQSDAIAGGQRSPNRDLLGIVRAHLASVRGAHAEAFDAYARGLTSAELVGDHSAIHVTAISLLRAFARAGREQAMLETAGIADGFVDEWLNQGLGVPDVFREPEPAVAAALARLGPEGEAAVEAGRSIEPSQRVKRLCSLIYAG